MRALSVLLLAAAAALPFRLAAAPGDQVKELRITILSTMLADGDEYGEWGFSALVEADGHRILFDTGLHPDTVLRNAGSLGIDLTTVPEVILSHDHEDHIGGLVTLRRAAMARNPKALAVVHVAPGIFYPRTSFNPGIQDNAALLMKPEYERTGGRFVSHDHPTELYPGVWLTGPVPRPYPEHNWSGDGKVQGPDGKWVEDTIPEDQALVFDTAPGLVLLVGCGHAGIVNTATYARSFLRPARFRAIVGGVHLFAASDETLAWTGRMLAGFGVDTFIGAHCTGLETVYRFRPLLGLDRAHDVVGAVGASYDLATGIHPGHLAQ